MAAHRYWALLVTARSGTGNGVAIAEVEMRSSVGGANIATGGTASGTNNVGHPPANAFDGNGATEWSDGATSGNAVRLSYDFGSAVDVVELVVTTPGAASAYPGATYGPAACWVQWSDNGTAWHYGRSAEDLSGLGNAASRTISGVSDQGPAFRRIGLAARVDTGGTVPSGSGRVLGGLQRHDMADGGAYRVAGTVKIDGTPPVPVRRQVRLFDVISGRLVRQTWSALDGTFSFERIRAGEYLVVSADYTRTYNAVVADRVLAVP